MFRTEQILSAGYPLESFPTLLLNAVIDVQEITKAAIPLIAASALGAAATACQGLADVQRPSIPTPIPISLNLLTIAESGDRKSASDSFFFTPIFEFESAQRATYQESLKNYTAELAVWKAKEKGLKQGINKNTRDGVCTHFLEQELVTLYRQKVQEPPRMRIALSDVTPAALGAELESNPCLAVLHSNEALDIIKGTALRNLPFLNRAWDGQRIEVDRRDTSKSIVVDNARLTTVLAVQPGGYKFLCESKNSYARDSGYLARTLISYPESTAGTRELDLNTSGEYSPYRLEKFHRKIHDLLTCAFRRHAENNSRMIMSFSPGAKLKWVNFFNSVEKELKQGNGKFYLIKDFAAKAAEHVARMAAIFELMSTDDKEISEDSVERAIKVVTWYLCHFDSLFGSTLLQNEIIKNSEILLNWLKEKSLKFTGNLYFAFTRRNIMQYGPKALRCGEKLDVSVECLINAKLIFYPSQSPNTISLATVSDTYSNYSPTSFPTKFSK